MKTKYECQSTTSDLAGTWCSDPDFGEISFAKTVTAV